MVATSAFGRQETPPYDKVLASPAWNGVRGPYTFLARRGDETLRVTIER